MTDPLAAAIQLAVIKYVTDHLSAARTNDLSPQVIATLAPGARLPVKVGDELIGWVSIPQPRKTAEVVSEAKFRAWVEETHPTEIVTDPRVRPSFEALVKQSVKDRGGYLNRATGELADVPGVERAVGDPYVKVDLEDRAGDIIAAAWRDGSINIGEMLALEAGDQ